ncbi:ATP-binding protein [Leptolyngbya sp. FACHB-711]|uniref:hybrid sensor histidine kinase/response regulator n=1 Tax=unclassified Leptolyngbya TaxID=2650499 RepID=UPI0016886A16|nr:ATP-binding protein [Leptolyngbya sp. FACHB-711]MBD1848703.1 response regulator [Cyanobacteria bacterium FACHB-502]MBD2025957.1 response regulator [Leptolyngbya sp. FACHB-711]
MANERILVVEDERVVARDIEKRLKKLGYSVPASVASGEEAVEKVAELRPELVLMDVRLKGQMDGIEAAEQIRADFDTPVIYLTAYADEATLQRAKVTDPFGYIVKPFDERDLHVAVEVALRRKLSETAIRVALEKEKELSELKSRFWSMAAHELRGPMTSILGCAQLLEQENHNLTEERRREFLYIIQQSVRSMNQLLDDLLSVGQAAGGSLKFKPASLNLDRFCRRLVEEIQFSTGSKHRILFNSQGHCENACLDQKLLRHILTNLISNAIKYSPQDRPVYFDLSCHEEQVTLQVRDMGIGIPSDAQKHLFEPFQRANNVGKIPGTGLGLTIVKHCLDLHGGQIDVESEVGEGTTFVVKLFQPLNSQLERTAPS